MIQIENVEVVGLEPAIRGMRNPMNSWDRSDSGICKGGDNGVGCENCVDICCDHAYDHEFKVGKNDYDLMQRLAAAGPVHAKYRRMITVYLDITAPLYWWSEYDTYKVGTVANSCSKMHKIADKEFTPDDFSHEHLSEPSIFQLNNTVRYLNDAREMYCKTKNKDYWWQMIQLLPSSYNQRRTVMLNYEVLADIYPMRKNHKLDEWREFCRWIESLPYSKLITGEEA